MACIPSATGEIVAGLPIVQAMIDNGDGTYSSTYSFTGGAGTKVSLSAELVGQNGIWVEYFNNMEMLGTPDKAVWEYQDLNYDWGSGLVTTSQAENVSVRWWGKLMAPQSGDFTFTIEHDSAFALYIDDVLMTDAWYFNGPQTTTFTMKMTKNRVYDYRQEFADDSGTSFAKVQWESRKVKLEYIPTTDLYMIERVGGTHNVVLI